MAWAGSPRLAAGLVAASLLLPLLVFPAGASEVQESEDELLALEMAVERLVVGPSGARVFWRGELVLPTPGRHALIASTLPAELERDALEVRVEGETARLISFSLLEAELPGALAAERRKLDEELELIAREQAALARAEGEDEALRAFLGRLGDPGAAAGAGERSVEGDEPRAAGSRPPAAGGAIEERYAFLRRELARLSQRAAERREQRIRLKSARLAADEERAALERAADARAGRARVELLAGEPGRVTLLVVESVSFNLRAGLVPRLVLSRPARLVREARVRNDGQHAYEDVRLAVLVKEEESERALELPGRHTLLPKGAVIAPASETPVRARLERRLEPGASAISRRLVVELSNAPWAAGQRWVGLDAPDADLERVFLPEDATEGEALVELPDDPAIRVERLRERAGAEGEDGNPEVLRELLLLESGHREPVRVELLVAPPRTGERAWRLDLEASTPGFTPSSALAGNGVEAEEEPSEAAVGHVLALTLEPGVEARVEALWRPEGRP